MIEFIPPIIDRLISLISSRHGSNRKLYEDFLAPLMADFEALHKNYLESFYSYRDAVEREAGVIDKSHALLKKIRNDSLFSEQLRNKLRSNFEVKINDPLAETIVAVKSYLMANAWFGTMLLDGYDKDRSERVMEQYARDLGADAKLTLRTNFPEHLGVFGFIEIDRRKNAARYTLLEGLTEIFSSQRKEEDKKWMSIYWIEGLVHQLQERHSIVIDCAIRAKRKLLDNRI